MLHTSLHRLLGEAPGPFTDAIVDAAVAQGLEESEDLDWKQALPDQKAFRISDVVKDIAAMANTGGGVIVFGIEEVDRAATSRTDAGELDENYERTIQQTCMSAITPPVFGVRAHPVGSAPTRAVALVVPASVDGPHLVYSNNLFGAPRRTNADTHWMKEREIEAAYRSRFETARRAQHELNELYEEMSEALDSEVSAVLVGVARPRIPTPATSRRHPAEATGVFNEATLLARWWMAGNANYHPLEDINIYTDLPGLRSWVAPPSMSTEPWRQGQAVLFDEGSVGLAWSAGGHRHGAKGEHLSPWVVRTPAIEAFVAALVALIHTAAAAHPSGDVEVLVGVEWTPTPGYEKQQRLRFVEPSAIESEAKSPIRMGFRRIITTVDPSVDAKSFIQAAIEISGDCLNQVGFRRLTTLDLSLPPRRRH